MSLLTLRMRDLVLVSQKQTQLLSRKFSLSAFLLEKEKFKRDKPHCNVGTIGQE